VVTNQETGTRIDEIANGIYRINTPLQIVPGGFSVSQYLIADEEPLLFHTGGRCSPWLRRRFRRLFPWSAFVTLACRTSRVTSAVR